MFSRLHPVQRRREAALQQHLADVLDVCDALLDLAEKHPMGKAPYEDAPHPVCDITGVMSLSTGTRRVAVKRGEQPHFPDPIQQTTQMYVRVKRDAGIFGRLPERERTLLASWFDLTHDVMLSFTSPSGSISLGTLGTDRKGSTYMTRDMVEKCGLASRADALVERLRTLQRNTVRIPWTEMLRHAAAGDQERRKQEALRPKHRTALGELLDL